MAVIFEQVIDEEFVEINCWTMMIFIDLSSKGLAENQSIHKASRNWLEFSKKHIQICVEYC